MVGVTPLFFKDYLMELEPVSIDQYRRGRDGRQVLVTADVGNVVKDLQAIDPNLKVRYAEAAGHFVVYQEIGDKQRLILTAKELDERIVNRIREIVSPEYDFVAEAEAIDSLANKAKEHELMEEAGAMAEHLSHAFRKELGLQKDSARRKKLS